MDWLKNNKTTVALVLSFMLHLLGFSEVVPSVSKLSGKPATQLAR